MNTYFRRIILLLVTVVLLASTGCKPGSKSDAGAGPTVSLPIVGKAPVWKLADLDGRDVTSEALKGKVVVVDFWATWCGPCVGEIPGYIALQQKYGKEGLVIVGASLDRKGPAHVRQFAKQNGMNYTLVMADDTVVEAFGGFDAIPTTFLIDREGNIRHKKTGSMEHEEYERIVKSVL